MILEQQIALLLQRNLNRSGKHAEQTGEQDLHSDLCFLDVDRRLDRIPERMDAEVELVAGPAGFDLSSAGNVLLEAVDVVRDPPPRLVLAEVVREVDFDGL